MSLTHSMKKAFGVHKATVSTSDGEFAALHADFRVTAKAAEDLVRAWAENIQWLQAQESSAALAINAVISSCGSDPNKPVVALQTTLAERLKTYVTAVRAQPTQQTNATKLIGAYATVCRSVQAVITKRAKAVEELDYYRGKLENYEKKSGDTTKLHKYRQEVETRRSAYESLNRFAIEGMRKALAQRDHIFHDVLAAFIDARAVHMAVAPDPYKELAATVRKHCPHLFSGQPWPELDSSIQSPAPSPQPPPPPFSPAPDKGAGEVWPPPPPPFSPTSDQGQPALYPTANAPDMPPSYEATFPADPKAKP